MRERCKVKNILQLDNDGLDETAFSEDQFIESGYDAKLHVLF